LEKPLQLQSALGVSDERHACCLFHIKGPHRAEHLLQSDILMAQLI